MIQLPATYAVAGKAYHGQQTVSQTTFRRLTKTRELITKKHYNEAITLLQTLLTRINGNNYEFALTQQSLAYAFLGKKDYTLATRALEAALAENQLPPEVSHNLRYNLAQAYVQTENYEQSLRVLEIWLSAEDNPPAHAHYLAAIVRYRLKQYTAAISQVSMAINKAEAFHEDWHQFLIAIYFERKQYQKAAPLLRTLIHRYPHKRAYWRQLSDVYLLLKREEKALSTLELALTYQDDILQEQDLIRMAQLYLHLDMPYNSARLLDQEMRQKRIKHNAKHLELLGNSWSLAHSPKRALKALNEAAELHQKGNLYLRCGHILMEQERWTEAALMLEKAIDKGGLKDPEYAQLMFGITSFQKGDLTRASNTLRKTYHHKQHRKQALRWLKHIEAANHAAPHHQ